nr:uncharacterized protein LOC121124653 [Lepeophtheirus salmonis]
MGSGSRALPSVGSSAKLALLELGNPFSSTGITIVRLRKAEQYGLCHSLGLVEEGREPWLLTRSEVCVRVRDHILQSRFHPMKSWFSVVPTLPFTSLGYECAMVSLLDHPKLDEGTSSEIDMSPRDEFFLYTDPFLTHDSNRERNRRKTTPFRLLPLQLDHHVL